MDQCVSPELSAKVQAIALSTIDLLTKVNDAYICALASGLGKIEISESASNFRRNQIDAASNTAVASADSFRKRLVFNELSAHIIKVVWLRSEHVNDVAFNIAGMLPPNLNGQNPRSNNFDILTVGALARHFDVNDKAVERIVNALVSYDLAERRQAKGKAHEIVGTPNLNTLMIETMIEVARVFEGSIRESDGIKI